MIFCKTALKQFVQWKVLIWLYKVMMHWFVYFGQNMGTYDDGNICYSEWIYVLAQCCVFDYILL